MVSHYDSELVRRLRRAGLVVLGKTNTPEFGMVPTCEPVLHGATRNPWDIDRSTSGSSGGSAAAVASRMVPIAHGNDLGGSLRYPASACGLFGLKPTRARVPLGPEYGDAVSGWACEHALTVSVRDSAALLDAVSGPAVGDPYVAPAPRRPFLAEVGTDPGRLRIGFSTRTRGRRCRPPRLRGRRRGRPAPADRPRSRGRRGRAPGSRPGGRIGDRDGLQLRDRVDHRRTGPDGWAARPPTTSSSRSPARTGSWDGR